MTDFLAFQLAYGLQGRTLMACEILGGSTRFARAVRYFGGMFCHFDREAKRWRLFGKVTSKKQIISAAERRQLDTGPEHGVGT